MTWFCRKSEYHTTYPDKPREGRRRAVQHRVSVVAAEHEGGRRRPCIDDADAFVNQSLGVADDLRKVFKINGDYLVPRIEMPRLVSPILNGWEVTALAGWQTGNPFTVFSGVDNSLSAIGADRANVTVANIKDAYEHHIPHPGIIGQWINPSDFAANAIGTFGDTGKNALYGPGYFDTDIAAVKNTKLGERVSMQLRAEAFNATNHVNFGLPGNVLNSTGFGQIGGTQGSGAYGGPTSYGTSQPRMFQFGVKTTF